MLTEIVEYQYKDHRLSARLTNRAPATGGNVTPIETPVWIFKLDNMHDEWKLGAPDDTPDDVKAALEAWADLHM